LFTSGAAVALATRNFCRQRAGKNILHFARQGENCENCLFPLFFHICPSHCLHKHRKCLPPGEMSIYSSLLSDSNHFSCVIFSKYVEETNEEFILQRDLLKYLEMEGFLQDLATTGLKYLEAIAGVRSQGMVGPPLYFRPELNLAKISSISSKYIIIFIICINLIFIRRIGHCAFEGASFG